MKGLVTLKTRPLEAFLLALLGGFSAAFLVLSRNYNPTAALFPRWVATASLVLLASLSIQRFGRPDAASRTFTEQVDARNLRPVSRIAIFAGQGAYILLIYLLGFFGATLLFLLLAPIQMRYKRWGVVVMHSVVLTLMVAGSFSWIFNVRLPSGIIWDLW